MLALAGLVFAWYSRKVSVALLDKYVEDRSVTATKEPTNTANLPTHVQPWYQENEGVLYVLYEAISGSKHVCVLG